MIDLKGLSDLTDTLNDMKDTPEQKGMTVIEVPVENLSSRSQIRKEFADIESLGASMKEQGQLMPINVSQDPKNPDRYIIEQGERRWRAAKQAGIPTLKCIVIEKPKTKKDRRVLQLTENLQRDNMRPHEVGLAFADLAQAGMTKSDIARALGWSRQRVQIFADLMNLPKKLYQASVDENISDAGTLQLWMRIYRLIGEERADVELEKFRDEHGHIQVSRAQTSQLLKQLREFENAVVTKPVSEAEQQAANIQVSEDEEPAKKEPQFEESLSSPGAPVESSSTTQGTAEGASNSTEASAPQEPEPPKRELPKRARSVRRTTFEVEVRHTSIMGKTITMPAILITDAVCEDADHVCVKYKDGTLDAVPASSIKILAGYE